MHTVKITVLKTTFDEKLAEEYDCTQNTPCPFYSVGQEFICHNGRKPEMLCDEAWAAFGKFVVALAHGADGFWHGWLPHKQISINSCNDGLRPVIFKLECISDE